MAINGDTEYLIKPEKKNKAKKKDGGAAKAAAFVIIGGLTLLYCVAELAAALWLGSLTLLSDGFHNLSDVVSLYIAYWAQTAAQRDLSKEMSYGWARSEILGGLTNGCFLLSLCLYVGLEAIPRLIHPETSAEMADQNGGYMFIGVAAVGLLLNTIGTLVLGAVGISHGHSHSHGHGHGHGHSHGPKESNKMSPVIDDEHSHGHKHKKDKKKKEHSHGHGDQEIEHKHKDKSHKHKEHEHGHDHDHKEHDGHEHDHDHKEHDGHEHKHKDKEHKHKDKDHKHKEHEHGHDHDHDHKEHDGHDHDHDHDHKEHDGHEHKHKDKKHKDKEHKHKDKDHKHKHDNHDHDHSHDHDEHDEHEHGHKKKKGGLASMDVNTKAVFLHFLGDAISSLCVLGVGLIMHFFRTYWWIKYLDPLSSVLIVLIILFTTIPLVKKCSMILLQSVPSEIDLDAVTEKSSTVDGVMSVHDLHVWQLVDGMVIASVHLMISEGTDVGTVVYQVKQIFHSFGIHSSAIQPEFVKSQNPETFCIQNCVEECVEDWCCKKTADKRKDLLEEYSTINEV